MCIKYLISACLAGELCRYDAKREKNDELLNVLKKLRYEFITICPEVLGGLPTPRPPSQIDRGDGRDVLDGNAKVIDALRTDVTYNFISGAQKALKIARSAGIKEAILNERSPSCGVKFIYNDDRIVDGRGITAALLTENGIEVISDEDFLKKMGS